MEWLIWAQESVPEMMDSGWTGAGLLGLVLSWVLLKHIPDKDKQAEKKDAQIMALVDKHHEQSNQQFQAYETKLAAIQQDHRDSMQQVINHCEKEMTRSVDRLYEAIGKEAKAS